MFPSTTDRPKQVSSGTFCGRNSMVEKRAFTPTVVGSTPSGRTMHPVVVVRPAVPGGRQQAFDHAGVAQRQSGWPTPNDSRGSSPFARTTTMNTKIANVHLELLQLPSAGTAVCVLA